MFEDMGERDFVEFLAAFWESRGWTTGIREWEADAYLVAGDRDNGTRGLMLVVPGEGATVDGQLMQKAASVIRSKGVDVGVAATRGSFAGEARQVANANDIHLLDPGALEQTIAQEDAFDLLEEFSSGGGRSLGDRLPGLPSPTIPLPGGRIRVILIVVVVLVVGYAGLGVVGLGDLPASLFASLPLPSIPLPSLPIPHLGLGLGGSSFPVTAVSLSQGSATPVDVRWDARRQESIVAPNGETFAAGANETFVVVQVNVSNPTNESMVFRANYLSLSANNTRYGNQFLKGGSGQLPVQVPAGGSKRAYVVYSIPKDAASATLLGLPGKKIPPMRFARDPELAFQATRG